LQDIVCGPDANTNATHVRALSDWMKMLLLTAVYKAYADGAAALNNLNHKK